MDPWGAHRGFAFWYAPIVSFVPVDGEITQAVIAGLGRIRRCCAAAGHERGGNDGKGKQSHGCFSGLAAVFSVAVLFVGGGVAVSLLVPVFSVALFALLALSVTALPGMVAFLPPSSLLSLDRKSVV